MSVFISFLAVRIKKVLNVNGISFFEDVLQFEKIKDIWWGSCLWYFSVTAGMPLEGFGSFVVLQWSMGPL